MCEKCRPSVSNIISFYWKNQQNGSLPRPDYNHRLLSNCMGGIKSPISLFIYVILFIDILLIVIPLSVTMLLVIQLCHFNDWHSAECHFSEYYVLVKSIDSLLAISFPFIEKINKMVAYPGLTIIIACLATARAVVKVQYPFFYTSFCSLTFCILSLF
jgi:hypothetical protein